MTPLLFIFESFSFFVLLPFLDDIKDDEHVVLVSLCCYTYKEVGNKIEFGFSFFVLLQQ